MRPRKIKQLCKVIAQAHKDNLINRQQAKTLMGQAKQGQPDAAMRGLKTIIDR